ncbi:MAG: MotA/TolQ/ExbB proton channel family protein [Flavobacteriia bacterium]|nr:MotA/TolQ/ExbB proton channel family protein [Flavobacteriia bacterium]
MKKVISTFVVVALMTFGIFQGSFAQDSTNTANTEAVSEAATEGESDNVSNDTKEAEPELSFVQVLKQKYIEGDPFWMAPVLICLIIGLALAIERVVYLNLATINTQKFLDQVEAALKSGGVEEAKEICRNTRGPIASIFYQGLDRSNEGLEMVEKSVVAYGGVQMGQLEKGLSWISLFIALAPMLGFLGTVIGMIFAFDQIVKDGQVSPTTVADGIKVALLTTVFGLIVAIILQIFYNYIVSKIDGLVNEMEDASISLIDMLLKNK